MTNLTRRIEKLEQRTGARGQAGLHLFVMQAGAKFALEFGRCAEILNERGFAVGVSVLDFSRVPHGLDVEELERYMHEHGEEICNLARRPSPRRRIPHAPAPITLSMLWWLVTRKRSGGVL